MAFQALSPAYRLVTAGNWNPGLLLTCQTRSRSVLVRCRAQDQRLAGVTLLTEQARRCGKQADLITGMVDMAGGTFFIYVGRVTTHCTAARLLMAVQAECIGTLYGQDFFPFQPVTAVAFLLINGFMEGFLEQGAAIGRMGAVALQTAFLNRIVAVRGDKTAGLHLMAGAAECIGLLFQKGRVLGTMGIMAGHAALIHGGVDKFFLELRLVMAGITGCLGLYFEQSRIGAVM